MAKSKLQTVLRDSKGIIHGYFIHCPIWPQLMLRHSTIREEIGLINCLHCLAESEYWFGSQPYDRDPDDA